MDGIRSCLADRDWNSFEYQLLLTFRERTGFCQEYDLT